MTKWEFIINLEWNTKDFTELSESLLSREKPATHSQIVWSLFTTVYFEFLEFDNQPKELT